MAGDPNTDRFLCTTSATISTHSSFFARISEAVIITKPIVKESKNQRSARLAKASWTARNQVGPNNYKFLNKGR